MSNSSWYVFISLRDPWIIWTYTSTCTTAGSLDYMNLFFYLHHCGIRGLYELIFLPAPLRDPWIIWTYSSTCTTAGSVDYMNLFFYLHHCGILGLYELILLPAPLRDPWIIWTYSSTCTTAWSVDYTILFFYLHVLIRRKIFKWTKKASREVFVASSAYFPVIYF